MLKLTPARAYLRGHTYNRLIKGISSRNHIANTPSCPPAVAQASCQEANIAIK